MNKYLLFFLLLSMKNSFETKAQNLVPNPSFEIYSSCPNEAGQIDSAVGWTIFGNGQNWGNGTPDYCNACANPNVYPDSLAGVPHNLGGFQQPDTGNAYAGLVCFATTVPNIREIIGCQLLSPLEIGQAYDVAFKANCSFGGIMGNYIACNGIGIKFTTIPYSNYNPIPINGNPAVYSAAVITDTLNWTQVEGTYVADSAYKYLALGNFITDENLDTLHLGSFIFRAYYYIDDVSVVKIIGNEIDEHYEKAWSVFPDPANERLYVYKKGASDLSVTLTNETGTIVFTGEHDFSQDDKMSIDVKKLPAGIYFIQLSDKNHVQRLPLLVQH